MTLQPGQICLLCIGRTEIAHSATYLKSICFQHTDKKTALSGALQFSEFLELSDSVCTHLLSTFLIFYYVFPIFISANKQKLYLGTTLYPKNLSPFKYNAWSQFGTLLFSVAEPSELGGVGGLRLPPPPRFW